MFSIIFWMLIMILSLGMFMALKDRISLSFAFSAFNAVICAFTQIEFYLCATVFLISFFAFILPHIIVSIVLILVKKCSNSNNLYGYVTKTVYPDIMGEVLVKGKIYRASSDKIYKNGCVVLCENTETGLVKIHNGNKKSGF